MPNTIPQKHESENAPVIQCLGASTGALICGVPALIFGALANGVQGALLAGPIGAAVGGCVGVVATSAALDEVAERDRTNRMKRD